MWMQGKRTGNIFFGTSVSSAFQAGFQWGFMPQNKFCGYEDSAFQAGNTFAVEAFNSPANLCLKGNNLHNRRYATCGQRQQENPCLKGRTTAVAQMNIRAGKKEKTKL